jgi:dihydroorotase
MTKSLLIKGGRLIDPAQGIDTTGYLLVSGNKISSVGRDLPSVIHCDVIDAEGLIVCAGFIDLHCHLRQPGFEHKETIATGTAAAARGGFTTVCSMPNTKPNLDNGLTVHYVNMIAENEGVVRVLPIGCVSKGSQNEEIVNMDELKAEGVVAFSDDGEPVRNSRIMRLALEYSRASKLPIIDHCEDKIYTKNGQVNEGVISVKLGLKGMPDYAEETIVHRDVSLVRLTGGKLHIAHVSTKGSVDIIRAAKAEGLSITAEATPHHLTLTEEEALDYNTQAKVNPPLRTTQDAQALIKGLNDGTIDIIATDHAPHSEADKNCEFAQAAFGISGLETAFGSLMSLVFQGELKLSTLIRKLTSEPAHILNNTRLGTLAAGAQADITIFNPNKEWVVDPNEFVSKGKNTPLAGRTLRGKIMATIYNGKPVYLDKSIKIEARENYG